MTYNTHSICQLLSVCKRILICPSTKWARPIKIGLIVSLEFFLKEPVGFIDIDLNYWDMRHYNVCSVTCIS